MPGRLAGSPSSYLRKSSEDLVDWYPWGDEAFEKAKKEDKPVLLSIGAVWCHWCHVMARESYRNEEIAKLINDRFVPIKVDRDQRPEVDRTYQEAVQALTGRGGWPLTVFLTSEREPFYGGTYFPDRQRYGMHSFKDVLTAISDVYHRDRGSINRTTNDLMMRYVQILPSRSKVGPEAITAAVDEIGDTYDPVNGGFGSSPKFPQADVLLMLLQRYEASGSGDVWRILDKTLHRMASGGMYDHLRGGFHRYSTDESWKVPHFEKMLTDNAQLLQAYLEAYQLSGDVYYRQVAEETLNFLFRDMARGDAGFASSMDADLHGEEGGYFVWTKKEIVAILGDRAEAFCEEYMVTEEGNFEHGKNILYRPGEADKDEFNDEKKKLLDARFKRETPYIDWTIHASWTALTVTSLVTAYNVLGDKRSLEFAEKTVGFMLDNMYESGTLYRIFAEMPSVNGYLEDYSCFMEALLELYNTTHKKNYLDFAVLLAKDCEERFFDSEHGGYFYVTKEDRGRMTQDKPLMDFSVPGSNPQMAMNLLKLYYYTDDKKYIDRVEALVEGFYDMTKGYPVGNATYYRALDYYLERPEQVVVIAEGNGRQELVDMVNGRLIRRVVLAGDEKHPSFEGKTMQDGKPTVYFCKEWQCIVPLSDREDINTMLKRPKM